VRLSACLVSTTSFAIENTEAFSNHHTCTSRIQESVFLNVGMQVLEG
jgi:hypothetical protein